VQSAFLLALLFLLVCSTITILSASEQQLVLEDEEEEDENWLAKLQIPELAEDRCALLHAKIQSFSESFWGLRIELAGQAADPGAGRRQVRCSSHEDKVLFCGLLGLSGGGWPSCESLSCTKTGALFFT
jgi:hypothetical protein